MASCPSCGAARPGEGPCPRCGASLDRPAEGPELELDVPSRRAQPAARPSPTEPEVALELAVDPREDAAARGPAPALQRADLGPARGVALVGTGANAAMVAGVPSDALLLADYGDPPEKALLTPFYAWRVLRRRRDLRRALIVRRAEAARSAGELEGALVAVVERVRPDVQTLPAFAPAVAELHEAEETLRSRDQVLATEQDAQNARLASVDARLKKLEAELAQAQADERAIAGELSGAQSALSREDAKVKRAESELRSPRSRNEER